MYVLDMLIKDILSHKILGISLQVIHLQNINYKWISVRSVLAGSTKT